MALCQQRPHFIIVAMMLYLIMVLVLEIITISISIRRFLCYVVSVLSEVIWNAGVLKIIQNYLKHNLLILPILNGHQMEFIMYALQLPRDFEFQMDGRCVIIMDK